MVSMTKLTKNILQNILLPEPFEAICEETGENPKVIADELRGLIDLRLITVMEWSESKSDYVQTLYYDSDNMQQHHFCITAKGLKMIA